MKRIQLFKRLAAFLVICGLLLPVAPSRVNAGMPPPPAPDYKTKFEVRQINGLTGAVGGALETQNWPLNHRGGTSFARPFRVAGINFIFFMGKHSGQASIRHFGQDGQIGAATDVRNLEPGWTSADFIYFGVNTLLVLHNSFTGQVRTHQVLPNGKFAAGQASNLSHSNFRDAYLFSPYLHNGLWHAFALDPWTGAAVATAGDWTNMTENQWTRGWTSVDHLPLANTAYRLAYKAAGDPQAEGAADAAQVGRLVIQKIGADGITPQEIYDDKIEEGWTSVSFVPVSGEPRSVPKILFYRNDTGDYKVRVFNPLSGLGPESESGDMGEGYTDLKAVNVGGRILLTVLNEENAKPFTAAGAEKMALTIHSNYKNKAIGYQFLLMQSGKVIYSRAHGLTRLEPAQTAMTPRTRLDLGSVGKMMTTMTTLKLVEQGKVFLNHPIADQIDQDKYPSVSNWVKQRDVIDLMKQTTGFERSSAGCKGDENTFQVTCQPFFTAEPKLECKNGVCERGYDNAHFGALRQVIENVSGTKTTAELVEYTHNLWAKQIDLGGSNAVSCSAFPNAYSYERCGGASGCAEHLGAWWRQEDLDTPYSTSCGAGGWHASARQMGEFLSAARYAKVLAGNVNDLFMSTEHTALVNGAPQAGATALGWEPAWQATTGGEKLLHKGGDRIGHAYITQLPNRMDAVLITNTSIADGLGSVLRDAYQYAAGLSSTPPNHVEVLAEGSAIGDGVIEMAVGTISNTNGGQHVTAARGIGGGFEVTGWSASESGLIKKEKTISESIISDPFVSEIAVTNGEGFVTAARNTVGKLKVTAWSAAEGLAANIKREGNATGESVSQVSATKLAGIGWLNGRVATATRNAQGNLQVSVWDFHNASNEVKQRDTFIAGAVSEVTVKVLRSSSSLAQATRLATAVRNGEGKLQVDIWDVDANGQLTRKGKAVVGAVALAAAKNKIAIGRFDDDDFFTASIGGDGKLEVIRWTVSESGLLTKGDQSGTGGEITEIAATGGATVMRLKSDDAKDNGTFKLINWRIVNGEFERYGEASSGSKVTQVAATGNVLSAMRLDNGTLRLIKWTVVD